MAVILADGVEEEWRPVVGWEGLYEVSDQGRVRSLDRPPMNGRRVTKDGDVRMWRYCKACKANSRRKTRSAA